MWPVVEVCWDKFLVRAILRGLFVVLEEILVFTAWKELLNYDGDDVGEVDFLFPSWKVVVLEKLVLCLHAIASVHSCVIGIIMKSSAPTLI